MVKAGMFHYILSWDYKIMQKTLVHRQYKATDGASNASPLNIAIVYGFKLTLCLVIIFSVIYILTIIY